VQSEKRAKKVKKKIAKYLDGKKSCVSLHSFYGTTYKALNRRFRGIEIRRID